ncbi:hypothetical protein [Candidatus Uabimicrobium sp. HlEnr_7]|uniref:hypothetical protein n=1 Tax=Candidatus Uabimicrobium helgolandensis TaxID=3095367 RepID=UPI003556FE52
MFRILLYLYFLSITLVFAGTPPVTNLEIEKTLFRFSKGNAIPTITISTKTDSGRSVIASEWNITPDLPAGLTFFRGQKKDKSKLFIQGTPTSNLDITEFEIAARNNGNIVKKLGFSKVKFKIIIENIKKIAFTKIIPENDEIRALSFYDLNNPESKTTFSEGYITERTAIAYGKNMFAAIIYNEEQDTDNIYFFDVVDNTIKKIISEDQLSSIPIAIRYGNGFFYVLGEHVFNGNFVLYSINENSDKIESETSIETSIETFYFNNMIVLQDKIVLSFSIDQGTVIEIPLNDLTNPKETADISFEFYAHNDTTLVLADTKNNKMHFKGVNEDNFTEVTPKEAELIIDENFVTYGNGHFWVGAKNPLFGISFLVPFSVIDGKYQQKEMIPIGLEKPIGIAYGNGLIAFVSETKLQVFYASNRRKIFEAATEDTYLAISFHHDHFFVHTTNKTMLLDTCDVKKGLIETEIPSTPVISNSSQEKSLGLIYKDKVCLLNTKNFETTLVKNVIPSRLVKKSSTYFVSVNKKEAHFFDIDKRKSHTIDLPDYVHEISTGENFFVFKHLNSSILSVTEGETLKQLELAEKPTAFLVRNAKLFALLSDKITIIDLNTLQEIYTCPFEGRGRTLDVSIYNNVASILISDMEDHTILIVDLQEKSLVAEMDGVFEEDSTLGRIFQLTEDKVLIASSNKLMIYSIELQKFIDEIEHYLDCESCAFGNNTLALTSWTESKVFLVNIKDMKFQDIKVRDPNKIYFANSKFMVSDDNNYFNIIDSVKKVIIGKIDMFSDEEFEILE